jgi:N-acetylglucosamine transport system permease protein
LDTPRGIDPVFAARLPRKVPLSNYVLTQGMASFASQAGYSGDFGALFAAVVITVVPVLIVYLIFQRQLQGSVSQGTNK